LPACIGIIHPNPINPSTHPPHQVDAALDATNVARVAHYIRSRTRQPGGQPPQPPAGGGSDQWRRGGGGEGEGDPAAAMAPFQSIVISLKDNFYEKVRGLGCWSRGIGDWCVGARCIGPLATGADDCNHPQQQNAN